MPPTVPDAPFGGWNVFEISEAELESATRRRPPGQVYLRVRVGSPPGGPHYPHHAPDGREAGTIGSITATGSPSGSLRFRA